MKILGLLNGFTSGTSGGDELFIQEMKQWSGNDVTIVTSELGRKYCRDRNILAHFLITSHEKSFHSVISTYLSRIMQALTVEYPKNMDRILTASDALPDTLPAFFIQRKTGALWTAYLYHMVPWERIISRLTQELSFQLMRWAHATINTTNPEMIEMLAKRGIPDTRIKLFKPKNIKTIKPSLSTKHFDAIWMGRIHPGKGIEDCVAIWKYILNQNPRAKLGVIGTGEATYIKKLQNHIESERLQDHIVLNGFVDDAEAFGMIQEAQCFIHTSHEEGYSLVIDEVLKNTQTPIIAYDLPVIKARSNNNITLVPSFDQIKFAETILTKL